MNEAKDLVKKVVDLIEDMREHINDEELLKEVANKIIKN